MAAATATATYPPMQAFPAPPPPPGGAPSSTSSSSSSSSSLGKRWEQFRHLDEAAYAREIAQLDGPQLTALHGRLKRKLITSSMGTAHGVWTAPATGGFSLVATGVAGRQTNLGVRRLRIVEARMAQVHAAHARTRKRDYAIPATCLGLSSAVADHCQGFFADHLVSENACQAADVAAGMAQEPIYGALYNRVSSSSSSPAGVATQLTTVQLAQGAPVSSIGASASAGPPGVMPSVPSPALAAQPSPTLPPRPASALASTANLSDAALPPALPPRPAPLFELEASLAPSLPPRPASALGAMSSAEAVELDAEVILAHESNILDRLDGSDQASFTDRSDKPLSTPLPPLIAVIPPSDEVAPAESAPCVVSVEAGSEQIASPATVVSEKEAIKQHIASAYPPPPPNAESNEDISHKKRHGSVSSQEADMPYFPPPPTYEASIAAQPACHRAGYTNSISKPPIPVHPAMAANGNFRMPLPEHYSIPAYNPADYVR